MHKRVKSKIRRKSVAPIFYGFYFLHFYPLFPFNRGGWLRGDIVDHAIDARYLIDDAVRDTRQQLVGQARPVGGHKVAGGDGSHSPKVGIGAEIAHHTHALYRRETRQGPAQAPVDTWLAHLFAN